MHPLESSAVAFEARELALQAGLAPPSIPPELQQVGSWVPADASGAGLVITVANANWVRQGRLVIARARISYPVTASGASALLSGLPFTTGVGEAQRQGFVSYSDAAVSLYLVPNTSVQTMNFFVNPGGANATNTQLSGRVIFLSAMYEAAQ